MLAHSRPNFFPGQVIDYRDFNRLAGQSDRSLSLALRFLYPEGGILKGALGGFEVIPLEDLKLMIKPGVAVLPDGQLLVLSKEYALDLGGYRSSNSQRIIVSIGHKLRGSDKYEDVQDSSITGYRSEVFEPELKVSSRQAGKGCVELFRVQLNGRAEKIKMPSIKQEWAGADLEAESELDALIDLRFRCELLPQPSNPLLGIKRVELRSALSQLRRSHQKLRDIYLYEDKARSQDVVQLLHAEILNVPQQPAKLAFIVSDLAERLCFYLERLRQHVGVQSESLDRTTVLDAIGELETLKNVSLFPEPPDLTRLISISNLFHKMVTYGQKKYSFVDSVQEGLRDVSDHNLAFEAKTSFGGHIFKRVDHIDSVDNKRFQVLAKDSQLRKVVASYQSGDRVSAKGRFVKEGTYTLQLHNIDPEKPLVLLGRQYIRRGGCRISYELNGKSIQVDRTELSKNDLWINKGIVCPTDILVAKGNCLKIRVEKSDLDFGFFNMALYQPIGENLTIELEQRNEKV